MKKNIFLCFVLGIIASCTNISNDKNHNIKKEINYSDLSTLDSLINISENTTDTIFLGFVMSMSSNEFKSHINELKKNKFNISYKNSNFISVPGEGNVDMGAGYTLKLDITGEIREKPVNGKGNYLLLPNFVNNKLNKLTILAIEHWDGYYGNDPFWIEGKVKDSSLALDDPIFKKAMLDNDLLSSIGDLRYKNNVIIYGGSLSTINYASEKYIYELMKQNVLKNKSIQENNKNIIF